MKWRGRQGSSNIEDRRRGGNAKRIGAVGGLGTIIIIVVVMLLGGDPDELLQGLEQSSGTPATGQTYTPTAEEDAMAEFVSVVLKETEDVWKMVFRDQLNAQYREPNLVLFTESDRSACGFASAATGPFYCPADSKVYLDLSFFNTLQSRLGASGDFAMAYVVAHEVGHHVQNLLGITDEVHRLRGKISEAEYNELSVRLELQADYLAGLWAHYADNQENLLDPGDIQEALGAASAVGDDRIQMRSRGYTVPESFTHGTSEQRQRWFYKGYTSGKLSDGDTFSADDL